MRALLKKILKILFILVLIVLPFSLILVGGFFIGRKLYLKHKRKLLEEIEP